MKLFILCWMILNVTGCKDKGKEMHGMENLPRSEDVITVVSGIPIPIDSEILNFNSRRITNVEWNVLATCTNLKQLYLDNNPVQSLSGIGILKKLKKLVVARTYVRDISHLVELDTLEELNIVRCFVTNLPRLPASLRRIYMDKELGEREILKLRKTNPDCIILHDDGFESTTNKKRGPLDPNVLNAPERYIPTWARGLE